MARLRMRCFRSFQTWWRPEQAVVFTERKGCGWRHFFGAAAVVAAEGELAEGYETTIKHGLSTRPGP
jgi:hypothetical protein